MSSGSIITGILPGQGCNTNLQKLHGESVEFEAIDSIGTGQTVLFSLQVIENSRQLLEVLQVSAKASFVGTGWNASAKAKFASRLEIHEYNVHLLASCIVTNPSQSLTKIRWKESALQYLKDNGWDAFHQTYGPEFLTGYITGGNYFGHVSINTRSRDEQIEISSSIGGGWAGGSSASGDFEKKVREIVKNKTVEVFVLRGGASGDTVNVSIDQMIKEARNFPAAVKENPLAILGIYSRYEDRLELPTDIGDTPLEDTIRFDALEELGKSYLFHKDLISRISYVLRAGLENFEDYQNLTSDQILNKKKEFQKAKQIASDYITKVVQQARKCQNPTNICEFLIPPVIDIQLPNIDGENRLIKQLEESLDKLTNKVNSLTDQGKIPKGLKMTLVDTFPKKSDYDQHIKNYKATNKKVKELGKTISYSQKGKLTIIRMGKDRKHYLYLNENSEIGICQPGSGGKCDAIKKPF